MRRTYLRRTQRESGTAVFTTMMNQAGPHPFLATTPTPPSCDLDKKSLASAKQGRLQEELARRNFKALGLEGAPWRRNSPFTVILWREL